MDDATSEIYSGLFVDEKGTLSTFAALDSVIAQKGLFCALYADRGGHYWHTPEADGKVDRDNPTQDGRALIQFGIELIPAYSPEARRRSERMFGTLQKRLPQERRLAGITTMAAVNRFSPRVRDRYSCRSPVPLRIFCASTKSASSATTTRCYYLGRYAADGAQKGKKGQQAA